jgi:muramidase (phage lysozyme)
MASRDPRQLIRKTDSITPVASPVDTFVQPKSQSGLRDLAKSLSGVNENLQQYFEFQHEQQAKKDIIKAKADAYSEKAPEIAKMIRDKTAPAQFSPDYINQFEASQGELAGGDLQVKFDQAFEQWPGKDQLNNEGGFHDFFMDFMKKNIDPNASEATLRGLLPKVNELEQNARAKFIAHQNNTLQTQALNTFGAGAIQDVQTRLDDALADEKGPDYATLMDGVLAKRAAYLKVGGNEADADKALMQGISGLAIKELDPRIMDSFLKTKVPGQSYTFGETPDGQQLGIQTKKTLEVIYGQMQTNEAEAKKLEMKKNLDEAQSGIVQALMANPVDQVPEELLKKAEQNGDPTIRTKLTEWRKNLTAGESSDTNEMLAITREIVQNPNVDPMVYIQRGLDANKIRRTEDLQSLFRFGQSVKGEQPLVKSILENQASKTYMDTFASRTRSVDDAMSLVPGVSDAAINAQSDYRMLMTQWILKNPEKANDPIELAKAQNEIGSSILNRLSAPDKALGDTGEGTYNRDPALEQQVGPAAVSGPKNTGEPTQPLEGSDAGDNEDTMAAPKEQPPQKNGAPAAASTDQQAQKWLDSLTPEQAKKWKDTYGDRSNEMVKRLMDQGSIARPMAYNPNDGDLGEGDRQGAGMTQSMAEGYLNELRSTTGGDDAERLLTLISNGEGTNGNYNAVAGNGGQQNVDLSGLTVDDILARQQWARQHGYPSTAVGKYQLLYKTLSSLKADGTVRGDEKFTPELQERAGRSLLDRRGYQEYKAGRISKRAFALRLSQEWASLPSPNTGRSFYAGDSAGNASRVSTSQVYDALGLTPASYGANEYDGQPIGNLTFDHPEQEAGVRSQLKGIVSSAYADIGVDNPEVISGYRSPDHPAEAGKASGGGEHTHGNAMDVSLRGLSDTQRAELVQALRARGAKRFITYSKYPDMLHVDLKDQRGNGQPYFMHDKSARNMNNAPDWFKQIAGYSTI